MRLFMSLMTSLNVNLYERHDLIRLKPKHLTRYMLRGLQADTQYEVRIVTLSTDDTTLINKKTFSCSQSTTFLTEISGGFLQFPFRIMF